MTFEQAADFDFETAIYLEDRRHEYGERRIRALGYIEARLYALVYTIRGDALRVISLRRANRREVRTYEEATQS